MPHGQTIKKSIENRLLLSNWNSALSLELTCWIPLLFSGTLVTNMNPVFDHLLWWQNGQSKTTVTLKDFLKDCALSLVNFINKLKINHYESMENRPFLLNLNHSSLSSHSEGSALQWIIGHKWWIWCLTIYCNGKMESQTLVTLKDVLKDCALPLINIFN